MPATYELDEILYRVDSENFECSIWYFRSHVKSFDPKTDFIHLAVNPSRTLIVKEKTRSQNYGGNSEFTETFGSYLYRIKSIKLLGIQVSR